ncbi:MAG: DUF4258 domain-containing protein [Candidatus Wallbacteria bacterium]|nr:DUF4258 domain-containing protein [Candidatus Wallbacteria bacterium]
MTDWIELIRDCFAEDRVLYSSHALSEMKNEEFGCITDKEIEESIGNGRIIELYPADEPYPSCLIYGKTGCDRPIHAVCAVSEKEHLCIIVTAYQPDPERWEQFERRKP